MLSLNRVSALLIIVTLGLISFFALPWPTRTMTLAGHDLTVSGKLLIAAAVTGLVATGTAVLARTERDDPPWYVPLSTGLWILPSLVCTLALAALNRMQEMSAQLLVCSGTVAALVALIQAGRSSVDPQSRLRSASRKVMEATGYYLMMVLMTVARSEQPSGTVLGMAAGVCGLAVTYVLFSQDVIRPWIAVSFALASGLAVGVAASIVASTARTPAAFGFVVTVVLYVCTGMVRGRLRGQLDKKRVLEYLLVAAAGLLVLAVSGA